VSPGGEPLEAWCRLELALCRQALLVASFL